MDAPLSSGTEALVWQLGCNNANIQVLNRRPYRVLHDQCHWEPKFLVPPSEQPEKCFPRPTGPAKGVVFGNVWSYQEMVHAHPKLGQSKGRTDHYVPWQITTVKYINSKVIEDLFADFYSPPLFSKLCTFIVHMHSTFSVFLVLYNSWHFFLNCI